MPLVVYVFQLTGVLCYPLVLVQLKKYQQFHSEPKVGVAGNVCRDLMSN